MINTILSDDCLISCFHKCDFDNGRMIQLVCKKWASLYPRQRWKKLNLYAMPFALLPEEFGDLVSMEDLKMYCTNLRSLPESFCQLSNLKKLDMSGPPLSLCELVDDVDMVMTLETLPKQFGQLKNLQVLHLAGCAFLKHLHSGRYTPTQDIEI